MRKKETVATLRLIGECAVLVLLATTSLPAQYKMDWKYWSSVDLAMLRHEAERGNPGAQTELGSRYENGQGLPKDASQAREWYQKAAKQGLSAAQVNLGSMYFGSSGIPQDYEAAYMWLKKAADQGDSEGEGLLGALYRGRLGTDYSVARMWTERSANHGNLESLWVLGDMYSRDEGAPHDYAKARYWYRKAVDSGDEGTREIGLQRLKALDAASPQRSASSQCPDWSPKFNQIDDPALVEPLRAQQQQGWDNIFQATSMTLQQQIAQGEQVVAQMQAAIKTDEEIFEQTEADNSPMPTVSSEECKDVQGAAMVAACDKHHQDNGILGMEGMLDLMRCRAGLPMSAPAAPSPADGNSASTVMAPAPPSSSPAVSGSQDQLGIPSSSNPNAPGACLQHLGESCYDPHHAGSLYFKGCVLVTDPKNPSSCVCYNQAKHEYCERMD